MRMNIIVTIILLVCMQSCKTILVIPQYVGVYQISLTKSKLGEYEHVDSIRNLQLIIKNDSTFEFSKDVPFIYRKSGTWRLEYTAPIDLPPFYRCSLNYGENNREDDLLPIDENITGCYLKYPLSKGDQEQQVELLQFTRIK